MKQRCQWVPKGDPVYEKYHDEEWGVRTYDDRRLFEFLVLESAQAGLSWSTILKKRSGYREAFAHFDPEKVARFTRREREKLLKNPAIVRHRQKIDATIKNAQLFLEVQKEYGSFSNYLAQFINPYHDTKKKRTFADIPLFTEQAESLAKDLKNRGFKFFGPLIGYAYMQAIGMVNDHTTDCFRYAEVEKINSLSEEERLKKILV